MPDYLIPLIGGLISLLAAMIGAFAGGGYVLMMFPIFLMLIPGTYAGHLAIVKLGALAITVMAGQIHFRKNSIRWKILAPLTFGGLIGTGIGTYLIQYQLNEELFKTLMGFTLLIGAFYLIIKREMGNERAHRRKINWRVLLEVIIYAMGIGVLNGMFGGVGIFTTLYLVFMFGLGFRTAIAYTMLSYLVTNGSQTTYLLITETIDPHLALYLVIGAGIGGYIGTRLQYSQGQKYIRYVTITLLLTLGIVSLVN
jgi:uncharacterized protein